MPHVVCLCAKCIDYLTDRQATRTMQIHQPRCVGKHRNIRGSSRPTGLTGPRKFDVPTHAMLVPADPPGILASEKYPRTEFCVVRMSDTARKISQCTDETKCRPYEGIVAQNGPTFLLHMVR